MESLKLLDQAIDSLDAIDSAAVRNEAEAQILNAFEGECYDLTEAETLATKYLRGAKRELALEILGAIDLDALRRAGLGNTAPDFSRDSAAERLEELGLDEDYLDIECLSRAEHYEWICTAPADEIVTHREQMLRAARDAHDALRYSVHRLELDGTTWIDEASWVGDDLDEARRIAEMTGRGSQGSVIVDAIAQTADFGDRVEKLGGTR
jgi:hypothetical protein